MGFEAFRDQLHAVCGRPDRGLVVFHSIASSHASAQHVVREYRNEGATPPQVDFVAWGQTAGQGREGRTWSSPAGAGVYVSLIRPDLKVASQTLPLRIAVALCTELNLSLRGRCRVRWPNDLMVGERKIAGILIDLHSQGDEPPVAVVSFGINHSADASVFSEPRATGFRGEGGDLGLADLVARMVSAVDEALEAALDFAEVRDAYASMSSHALGDSMILRGRTEPLKGLFRGFDAQGFLRLEVDGEEITLSSGMVSG